MKPQPFNVKQKENHPRFFYIHCPPYYNVNISGNLQISPFLFGYKPVIPTSFHILFLSVVSYMRDLQGCFQYRETNDNSARAHISRSVS